MLIVLDDVLDPQSLEEMQTYFSVGTNRSMHWYDLDYLEMTSDRSPLAELLQISAKYVDLYNMTGVELWSHLGTRPDWHVDKDEILAQRTGEIQTPICSLVYYAEVKNLIGGRFLTEFEMITPKTNRLIIFSPNLLHGVEPYEGYRMSVAINPWLKQPLTQGALNA